MNKNLITGISLTLISSLSYAIQTAIIKNMGSSIPLPLTVLAQSLMSLLLILPIILKHKHQIKTQQKRLHLIRAIFSVGIGYCLFFAVMHIPLVNAVLLVNTAPILVPLLGFIFFKNKINHKLWLPIFLGFSGVVILLHPKGSMLDIADLIAFAGAICMAMSLLLVKRLAKKDNPTTISFYYFLFSTLLTFVIAVPYFKALPLTAILVLILIGSLFFVVQMTLTMALNNTSADIVGSLYYSNVLFAAIISLAVWKTPLTLTTLSGMFLTIIGGILTIHLQARSNKELKN